MFSVHCCRTAFELYACIMYRKSGNGLFTLCNNFMHLKTHPNVNVISSSNWQIQVHSNVMNFDAVGNCQALTVLCFMYPFDAFTQIPTKTLKFSTTLSQSANHIYAFNSNIYKLFFLNNWESSNQANTYGIMVTGYTHSHTCLMFNFQMKFYSSNCLDCLTTTR